jgi:putative chitinase
MITLAQFRRFLPKNRYVEQWYAALLGPQDEFGGHSLLNEYDINTPKRIAAFLAQCSHESGGFMFLTENLNYRAAGLRRVFPNYFKTDEIASQYERKPEKIANRVYANRMGNGDESSGDGYRFCGRGLIQLTGRNNYQAFADSIEIPIGDVPAYLGTFEGAAQSACWFWETNRLNRFVDSNDFKGLTKAINGGYIGLEDREHHYEVALNIFRSDSRLA